MAGLIPLGEAVTRGEQKMLNYLQRTLPDDWIVFGNAQVTTGELSREVDAVVVGDRCVWVVDEKGFGGSISGDEHTWILANGSARERVLNHILHAAKMVKGKLEAANPRLAHVWVEGLILLSADDADVRVEDQRITRHVRRLAGCENYFLRANIPNTRGLQRGDREVIQRCLSGEAIVDRLGRRFTRIGPYDLVETLSSGPIVCTYRAERQRTGEVVELKVYDLSALPESQTRQEMRKRVEREFDALRKLRDTEGVVRVAESFQPVEGYGGELYYFALDLPAGPCLASRLSEASWSFESRFAAAKRLCEIIHVIHQAGVIHRNLSPVCIYFWRIESDFQLTGFEFSRLPTTTLQIPAEFYAGPYTAPEVTDSPHNASKASDIFSLGVILFELLSKCRPFGNRTRTREDPDPLLQLAEDLLSPSQSDDLGALLQLMVAYARQDRPQDLGDVLSALDELSHQIPVRARPPISPSHPLPEGAQLGEFTILAYLGTGGCFHAYRVANHADDTQEYVAKVVRYPELLETARRSFIALSALDHPNIIRAFDVRARTDAPYHLLEVYAPGRSARDIIAGGRTQAAKVAKWGAALAEALAYMETRNPPIYHGDISPRNIILDDDRPHLVDFGLAYLGEAGHEGGVTGTAPYRPPERDVPGAPWPPNGDVYSLGLVLCELLFGELPYHCDGGQWNKLLLREDFFEPRGWVSAEFLQVLRRAVGPDPAERFRSAADFQRTLVAVPELGGAAESPRQERGINRYLDDVLKVYNRGACNAENRGLDSTFARVTYVPTELDTQLLPDILSHKYALVILAGNPGDGKTAFLQQLALQLGFQEKGLPLNHWILNRDRWTFECVLDGSAADSNRGLSSDQVLDAIFGPLEKAGAGLDLAESLRRTHLLAINDGRLLEYLTDRSEDGSWVVHHLLMLLGEESGTPHPQLALVDLNRRSLVAADKGNAFDAVLTALLQGGWGEHRPSEDPWQVCLRCRAASSCHVRFNVDTLLHPTLGPRVRERLRMLLMVIHSRGRLHITMRELRSMLAFLFFGDQACEQIHDELEETVLDDEEVQEQAAAQLRPRQRERIYLNRLFIAGARGGRLFEELSDFDPARVDNPRFDRLVAAAQRSLPNIEPLFITTEGRIPHAALSFEAGTWARTSEEVSHGELRRRAFFEGRAENWGPNPSENFWLEMTPFRSMRKWVDNLVRFRQGRRELPQELCRLICRAVSLTDNVPEELLDRYLAVRTASSPKTDLVVVRLFDLSDFQLVWEQAKTRATVFGELPTAMLLQYGARFNPMLEVSADLFELLIRFAEGYRLGSEELEGIAGHLQLFKNRLLAMPATEVCLLHPALGQFMAKQRLIEGIRQIALEVLR